MTSYSILLFTDAMIYYAMTKAKNRPNQLFSLSPMNFHWNSSHSSIFSESGLNELTDLFFVLNNNSLLCEQSVYLD